MKKIVITILCTLLITLPISTKASTLDDFVVEANGTADVTINLFDYWLQEGVDIVDPESRENYGINQNHLLLFHALTSETVNGANRVVTDFGRWNAWDENEQWSPVTGIVSKTLNENGYPVLNIAEEDIAATDWLNTRQNESLEYLFNPEIEVPYRTVYKNVGGLFQRSANRGDFYSSYENFAEYDSTTNRFILYKKPGVIGVRATGQFFPLNKGEDVFTIENNELVTSDVSSTDGVLNHYLGMTIETEFTQPVNGKAINEDTQTEQDMIYTFTGDDDIWIYIDNVLVADLGGIHNALTSEINFATGKVTIRPSDSSVATEENTTEYYLGDIYAEATPEYTNEYMATNFIKETDEAEVTTKYTFTDNSTHTLKIFYLERGNTDSNLEASFWPSINGDINNEIETPPEQIVEEENPETNDLFIVAICGIAISILGVVAIARFYKYKIKNT